MNVVAEVAELDPLLSSSWKRFEAFFLECLRRDDTVPALSLITRFGGDEWRYAVSTSYFYYAVALLARTGDVAATLDRLRSAWLYGYGQFWRFEPLSHGWAVRGLQYDASARRWVDGEGRWIHEDDPHRIHERHRFLEPFYEQEELVRFVRSVHDGRVDAFTPEEGAPLCWLEETTLNRKSARCPVTRARLAKGDPVYEVRYFNGAADVATDPFYVAKRAMNESSAFREAVREYMEDSVALAQFRHRAEYRHARINQFWRVSRFDPEVAFDLVANAETHSTGYEWVLADGSRREGEPSRVLSRTAGEFVNLSWVLLKSGYWRTLSKRLPELPRALVVMLLLFDRPALRREVAAYLGIPELVDVYEQLFKPRLSAKEIAGLVRFGAAHPEFQEQLAESLNLYEYHLYSNYSWGPNWFYRDFRHLVNAKGGRFLYLVASRYAAMPVLRGMSEHGGIASSELGTYQNTAPFFLQALMFGLHLEGRVDARSFIDSARLETTLLKRAHADALKVLPLLG